MVEEDQGCPVLVLRSEPENPLAHLKIRRTSGHCFAADAREIGEYLADVHGIGLRH